MAISNLTYKDYLWIKKENSNIYGIRLSKSNLPTSTVYTDTIQTISGVKTFSTQQKFTVANGTSPFTVTSSTKVNNLNADKIDGFDINDYGYQYQSSATINLVRTNLVNADAPIYVKLTTPNRYYSQHLRFKVKGSYDNVGGSTEITCYCRAQNEFYFDTISYNGSKLIGVYQPTADTDIYYLKFSKFDGSYTSNPNTGSITVYAQIPGINLTLIEEGHADYTTVSSYGYFAVPNKGIYGSHLWSDIYPSGNKIRNLGSINYQWNNIYGTVIYENGISLASKYAEKSHTHNYAASDSAGGSANSVKNALTFGSKTYDGSEAKTITLNDLGGTTINDVLNSSIPLRAGTNVSIVSDNSGVIISADGSVKKVNNISPDNSGNISLGLATVATSGSYNDLSNKPSIPNPTNYYWANVNISSSSSKTTTPIFDSVEIKEKCTVSYSATSDALEFIFK